MPFMISINQCRYLLDGQPDSLTDLCREEPILVSKLNDDNYFVHSGHDRVLRAKKCGEKMILAEWKTDPKNHAACGRNFTHYPHMFGQNRLRTCDGVTR